MERIDLYDRYINNQLSDKERDEFDARLKSDKEFASDFKIYLFTVDGVCPVISPLTHHHSLRLYLSVLHRL